MVFLSSLTELLTGTVTDQFKKLVQPASLVAAGIFLALHLVLVLPVLSDQGWGLALSLEAMPVAWQAILGALILLLLGYLLNSLGSTFLSVLNGAVLWDSPLVGRWLVSTQRRRYNRLSRWATQAEDWVARDKAVRRLATEFPREHEIVGTHLGNVLMNAASYAETMYGPNLDAVWPLMDVALRDDTELRGRLGETHDSLVFLATLASLLVIFAGEWAALQLYLGQPRPATWAILGVVGAYMVYSAAVQRALAWNQDVRTALDLYLQKASDKAGLLPIEGYGTEDKRHQRWADVTRWRTFGMLSGQNIGRAGAPLVPDWYSPKPQPDWYYPVPQPPPGFTFQLQYPPAVSVWPTQAPGNVRRDAWRDDDARQWVLGGRADYVFALTNNDHGPDAQAVRGCYLLVIDSRLATVPARTEGQLITSGQAGFGRDDGQAGRHITGRRQAGKLPGLLWLIGDLQPLASAVLTYSVYDDEVCAGIEPETFRILDLAEVELIDATGEKAIWTRIRVTNAGNAGRPRITVVLPQDAVLPKFGYYRVPVAEVQTIPEKQMILDSAMTAGQRVAWTTPEDLQAGATADVYFRRRKS